MRETGSSPSPFLFPDDLSRGEDPNVADHAAHPPSTQTRGDVVSGVPVSPLRLRGSRSARSDVFLGVATRGSAVLVIFMLAALVLVVGVQAWPSVRDAGVSFVTSSEWRPNELEVPKKAADGSVVITDGEVEMETLPPKFGAAAVIYGTTVSSVLALLVAVPLSLGTSIFLIRVAPRFRIAAPISFLVEFLAAIPSIAFGIWGLFVLAPLLGNTIEPGLKSLLGSVPGLQWLFFENITAGGQ